MIWVFPLAILIFFELVADVLAKEWSLGHRSWWFVVLSLLAYLLANTSWLIALKYGSGLGRGATVFSVASATLAVLVGFIIYREEFTWLQGVGVVVGIISLALVFWE